jgi:hypothetical protein
MAYLPIGTDSYRDQDIRQVLARLAKLAEVTNCAVLLLRHLNKGSGRDPLYRGGGSIGIVGAARAGLLVASDPDDPETRVFASVKNNLAPKSRSLTYQLINVDSLDVAQVWWTGVSDHDAYALLAEHREADDGVATIRAEARARGWLEDYLGENVRVPSRDAKAEGMAQGYSEASIKRAASKLGVVSEAEGFPRMTYWSLPVQSAQTAQLSQPLRAGPTEPTESTGGFKLPSGPGRCPQCGWHVPKMGHHPDCPAIINGEESA